MGRLSVGCPSTFESQEREVIWKNWKRVEAPGREENDRFMGFQFFFKRHDSH